MVIKGPPLAGTLCFGESLGWIGYGDVKGPL